VLVVVYSLCNRGVYNPRPGVEWTEVEREAEIESVDLNIRDADEANVGKRRCMSAKNDILRGNRMKFAQHA
jgi:hypothetical protein